VSARLLVAEQKRDQLDRALAVEERLDQRLRDAQRTVPRASVAPRLEEVRPGQAPSAFAPGLVVVQAEVDARPHFRERGGEFEVLRRVVHGVAAEDDERVHGAGFHFAHERRQRRGMPGADRGLLDGVANGPPDGRLARR